MCLMSKEDEEKELAEQKQAEVGRLGKTANGNKGFDTGGEHDKLGASRHADGIGLNFFKTNC